MLGAPCVFVDDSKDLLKVDTWSPPRAGLQLYNSATTWPPKEDEIDNKSIYSYTLFKNAKTSPKWWFSTFLHGKQWIMRTSKNFGAIFLIGSLPTTRPLSQKKQFLASWKVTNHQGAGSIARRSQWWKMRQACQSVWKICKNDLDVWFFEIIVLH